MSKKSPSQAPVSLKMEVLCLTPLLKPTKQCYQILQQLCEGVSLYLVLAGDLDGGERDEHAALLCVALRHGGEGDAGSRHTRRRQEQVINKTTGHK